MEKDQSKRYEPAKIEPKWQQTWEETGVYRRDDNAPGEKLYTLAMFPYPSGDLHTGHWWAFVPADTYARFQRMTGHNVLHPIGFDAFGLPAENAAIKRNIPPAKWTDQNIANMTRQFKRMGPMYDWNQTVDTSKPDYYRWTQWLFLKLYEQGLAYRAMGLQNWCPKDQTVLANEQTISESGEKGVCVRCGTKVEKRWMEQWYFKITDYADRLLHDLDQVVWPHKVKLMQENWIGRSEGAQIDFKAGDETITVYTTRPDTLYGVTYMVLAPEHPLVHKITTKSHEQQVDEYIKATNREIDVDRLEETKDKTGVFTGAYAVNPINGQEIPIWIADYVLMSYGTGAIMAVPAHDQRDYDFATKFKLPIKYVVDPVTGSKQSNPVKKNKIVALVENEHGEVLTINWGRALGGRLLVGGTVKAGEDPLETAHREIAEETGLKDLRLVSQSEETIHHEYFAHSKEQAFIAHVKAFSFKLDYDQVGEQQLEDNEKGKFVVEWVSHEQAQREIVDPLHRYVYDKFVVGSVYSGYGPLINSGEFDGLAGEEAKRAIVGKLAEIGVGYATTNYKLRDWLISRQRYWGAPIPIVYCDDCGIVPVPEDQLPVELPLDVEFTPTGRSPLAERPDFYETACPRCGRPARRETDTMDTFVDSSWYFLRFASPHYADGPWDPKAVAEWLPVDQYTGGIEHAILHLLYARFVTKALYDMKLIGFTEPFKRLFNQGIVLGPDSQKMSKSRGNVVNPEDWVDKYGADTFRMYLMFLGPWDQGGPFSPGGIGGVNRFLYRVWQLVIDYLETGDAPAETSTLETALATTTHKTIRKVTRDLEDFGFNTAVAGLMEFVNELVKLRRDLPFGQAKVAWGETISSLVRMLAPMAPHISEELWRQLGNETSIHVASWPEYREDMVRDDLVEIVVQVNGRLRGSVVMPAAATEAEVTAAARADANVAKYLAEGEQIKIVVVPRKLVNFVVK